jgi:hypothetical protein
VFSHPEQIARLSASCAEAVPSAVLAGDPCFDRILAALPYRERFRRALGVRPAQRLVVLNSTWNPTSLFGDAGAEDVFPLLLRRCAAELPLDEFRLAAVLHPNIAAGHGQGQLRMWLDGARRAGLALVDPLRDWRQALIAADLVVGDFGSVTYYGAALGKPVLLGAVDPEALDPGSPVAAFTRAAPRLDVHAPVLPQIEESLRTHRPLAWTADLATSAPGGSAELLRALFYRLIGVPEPDGPALLDPLPLPAYDPAAPTAPVRVTTTVRPDGSVELRRLPLSAGRPDADDGTGGHGGTGAEDGRVATHLAVHEDTLDPGALEIADLIWRQGDPGDPRLGPPHRWAAETLDRHPGCALAVFVTGPGTCVTRDRTGLLAELTVAGADPAAGASAGLALGQPPPATFHVRLGDRVQRVRSRLLDGRGAPGALGETPLPQVVQVPQMDDGVLRTQGDCGAVGEP